MSSIMLYGSETWTIEGQKKIEAFAMCSYERMLRITKKGVLNKIFKKNDDYRNV